MVFDLVRGERINLVLRLLQYVRRIGSEKVVYEFDDICCVSIETGAPSIYKNLIDLGRISCQCAWFGMVVVWPPGVSDLA